MLAAGTLPFAILTWWAIVAPLLTLVAVVIALAATGRRAVSTDARIGGLLERPLASVET